MKRMTIGITGISSILLVACGGNPKDSQSTTPMSQNQASQGGAHNHGQGPGVTPAIIDVSDWSTWTKVTKQRIHSKGHNNMWVDIYVPPEHAAAYTDPSAPLEGMRIVKAQYPDETTDEPKNLTVMVRDEATDSKWFWGVYEPAGDKSMDAGQIDSCISCHDSATDMLFRQIE